MKKVLLKEVTIEGFKCYKEKKVESFDSSTIFVGGNGKGKSSIADAIAWVVTGKLYSGNKQVDNNFLNKKSSKAVVELLFEDENGEERTIKRSFTEASGVSIWLDGKKISQKALSLEIDTDTFLLAFNPLTFLGKKPTEARNLIINLVDVKAVDDKTILSNLYKDTQDNLNGIDLANTDSELKMVRKSISDKEKENIVIEGYISKNKLELSSLVIPEKKTVLNETILKEEEKLKNLIDNKPDMSEYMDLVGKRSAISNKIAEIKSSKFDNTKILTLQNEKALILRDIKETESLMFTHKSMIALETELASQEKEVYKLNAENSNLRVKIRNIRSKYSFKVGDTCPACRQNINENALTNINSFVENQTKEYIDRGISNKNDIETIEAKVKGLLAEIQKVKTDEDKRRVEFEDNKFKKISNLKAKVVSIDNQIVELINEQNKFMTNINNEVNKLMEEFNKIDLDNSKKVIDEYAVTLEEQRKVVENLKKENATIIEFNNNIERIVLRKEQLEKEIEGYKVKAKSISDEITSLTLIKNSITEFNQMKIRLIEDNIKTYFDKVSLKVEEVNQNTGEITSCFKVLYNNKPIETCSLSEQVKAGIEITEMVQNNLGIDYPVFLDNNESVTEIKALNRQVIRAVVIDVPEVVSIKEELLNEVYETAKNIVLKAS